MMTPTRCRFAVLLVLAALLSGCQQMTVDPRPSEQGNATVERVVDGDTVQLRGLGKARLIGVDTPEVFGEQECFGEQASEYSKRTLTGREVHYTVGKEQRDRYGRLLVYLRLSDGRFFNALVLEKGYGRPLAIRPNTRYAGRFRELADQARVAGRGLWAACPR